MARTLSAQLLTKVLAPAWSLDQAYLDRSVARDAYLREDNQAIVLAFEGPAESFRIAIAPHVHGPCAAKAAGLTITHEACADTTHARELCRRIAGELSSLSGSDWSSLSDVPPESIAAEVRIEPAEVPTDRTLQRDLHHYAMLYGPSPSAHRIVVGGVAPEGESIHYPAPWRGPVPASAAIYPPPLRVRRRRPLRAHFARLGCVLDPDGMPRTVPTPRTLNRALRSRGRHVPLRWLQQWRGPLRGPEWVRYLLRERALPVTVAPRAIAHAHVLVRRLAPKLSLAADVGMLVHDASLHGLVFSDVPDARWDDWASRAERIRRRGRSAAEHIANFYENDLTRACWAAWAETNRPSELSAAFEVHAKKLDELLQEIESRHAGPPC